MTVRTTIGLAIACSGALLTGCAQMEQAQARIAAQQAEIERTAPTCNTARECEVKWSAARTFLLSNSRMRLQTITPDFLETYNSPSSDPGLAWRVTKEAVGESSYRIVGRAWCGNMFGCVPDARLTMLAFNRAVSNSWTSEPTTSSPTPATALPSNTSEPSSLYDLRSKAK